MKHTITPVQFNVSEKSGKVGTGHGLSLLMLPKEPTYFLLFAHGAGAGMNHIFMEKMADCLANEHIATLRYHFPYTEKNKKIPDHASVLIETVQSAFHVAKVYAKNLPILAGGKSMGGRMTSMAASNGLLPDVKGIVFFGFPLHAPGKPSGDRAEHLYQVEVPMLFLQGTKDKLADLTLFRPVLAKLGNKATLYTVEGADHSFHLPKASGRNDDDVFKEVALKVKEWADQSEFL